MLLYHVTSVLNRESIAQHGLDWRRMGAARGIAGSRAPVDSQEGYSYLPRAVPPGQLRLVRQDVAAAEEGR